MKKVLALILSLIIVLSTVVTSMLVSASINSYDILTTESTSPDNLVGASSGVSISMNGNKITTASYNGYKLGTNNWYMWRPTFFFRTQNGGNKTKFMTKKDTKYVVEMQYVVGSTRSDNHCLQVGLFGNIDTQGQTEKAIWLDTDLNGNKKYNTHPQSDNGKTVNYAVSFVAQKEHNVGLIFYGQGSVTLNKIKITEVPDDYAVVTYIDGGEETKEIVKKNTSVKALQKEGYDFGGWYETADYTGAEVTNIADDITLYAKWNLQGDSADYNIYDVYTTKYGSNYVGAPSGADFTDSTIKANDYSYKLSAIGWKNCYRQTLLFVDKNTGAEIKLKSGAKYIVNMKYRIGTTAANDSWGLQIGLFGGISSKGETSSTSTRPADYILYKTADRDKEFTQSVVFTATADQNIGLQFAGYGTVTFDSITVSEVPASKVENFVVATYVDNKETVKEFVKKNEPLKTPEREFYIFGGWFKDSEFKGEAVTSISEDTTLYAKWDLDESIVVIDFYDGDTVETVKYDVGDDLNKTPTKEGYNFLGWYKYSNYIGKPYTKAAKGLTELYAKWEELNPQTEQTVDFSKNTSLVTTSKTAESKLTLDGEKFVFNIHNYERQLNSTDANSDSWFPSYYFKDSDGNKVALEIGTTYELEVAYKIVAVGAGDTVGVQIGFGADGQSGQTRTKIKGYALHKATDEGKEFTYSTSYTAEKFNFGTEHLPKLIFSGQGTVEVTSVTIKKVLPVIKDTVIGEQTYEDYEVGIETGVLGNKKGTEVSNSANHTSGLFKNKSLKLELNTEYLRLSGNTIISLPKDGVQKPPVAEKGGAYRVTFYMYANQDMNDLHWSVNSIDDVKTKDYFTYFKVEKDGKVNLKKGEWTKIEAYIPVLRGGESAKNLFAIAVASNGYDGKAVYIDDVKIEQLVDSEVVLYNSVGGSDLEPQRAFKGEEMLSFKEPVKSGYLFDGWYYDAEYTLEANTYDKFPMDKDEITLYAKWIEAPTTAYNFTAGSFDGEIYNENVVPYENIMVDMDADLNGENNKGITQNAAWVKDAGIYGNGTAETDGALMFSNELFSAYNDAKSYNAVRVTNEDGTPFTVVKGGRYTIEFDYIFASNKGLSYVMPIISEHSAYTEIGTNTIQRIGRVSVMETDTDYMTYKQSFVAEKTGYVYLALTGRDDNANVDAHVYEKVYVDNLKINVNNDVTKLEIKNGDTLWYTKYGIKGEKLIMANAVKQSTDTFDGFYLDKEFIRKFDGYYPAEDTTIYVKLKKDKFDTPSDFSNPIVIGFEETELLEDFYRQQKYMTSWTRETENEWIFVTDDEKNAFSGKNYIKLNGYGHYWNQAKFSLYDPAHPENVMLLDKGGKYRIKVMVRCEDAYESPVNMTVCLENPAKQYLLEENGSVKLEYYPEGDEKGYFMFVGDIEVKSDMSYYPSLAIRRNANDLQSLFIDTVSVEKLRDCTVKFEENGGSSVDDITLQIHDLLFDPGVPYKEGFVFDGWFTDNNFTKQWDFDNNTVENDMTLYAKWSVEVIDDEPLEKEEPQETEPEEKEEPENNNIQDDDTDDEFIIDDYYDDDYSDEEEIIGNGKAPNLLDADAVVLDNLSGENADNADGGLPVWVIILICAGGALVLASGVFVGIILIRKKKNKKA